LLAAICYLRATVNPENTPGAAHSRLLALRTRIPSLRSKSKANSRKSAHNAAAKESKAKTMKRKHLFLALAALLAAGGFWLARSSWRSDHSASQKSPADATAFQSPSDHPNSSQMTNPARRHAPPDPTRKFREFTPEQRVEFAREGHGPGG
jgi:hypothetical protein